MNLQPLEVEMLVSDDARRLQTATDSARPLPAGEVEELLAELRRIESEKPNRRQEP
jgi:hypothetical protein